MRQSTAVISKLPFVISFLLVHVRVTSPVDRKKSISPADTPERLFAVNCEYTVKCVFN